MTDLVQTITTTLSVPPPMTKADQLHALSERYQETLAQLTIQCESLAQEFEQVISDRLDEIVSEANKVREEIRDVFADLRVEADEQSELLELLDSAEMEMETECEPTVDVSIDDEVDLDVFDNLQDIIQHLRDVP